MKNLKQELLNEKEALIKQRANTQKKLKAHFAESSDEGTKILKSTLITAGGVLLGYQAIKLAMLPFKKRKKDSPAAPEQSSLGAEQRGNNGGIWHLLKQQLVLTATQMAKDAALDFIENYLKKKKK